jgi:TRAP-type C4-dicarboxylate transport system permease small subunit
MWTRFARTVDRALGLIEDWSLFISVTVALVVAMANVVLRKLTSELNLYWSDEVVRKVIFLSTYLGCVAAIRSRALIRIDVFPQLIPALKKPLTMINHLAVLIFSGCMLWFGWALMRMMYADEYAKTTSLQIPEWYFYAVFPVIGVMMILRTVLLIVEDWRGVSALTPPPSGEQGDD